MRQMADGGQLIMVARTPTAMLGSLTGYDQEWDCAGLVNLFAVFIIQCLDLRIHGKQTPEREFSPGLRIAVDTAPTKPVL